MADSLNDVFLTTNTWVDLYSLTGIAPGTSLVINNKSSATVFLLVRASQPVGSSNDGWPLKQGNLDGNWTVVEKVPSSSRVWAKGGTGGRLFVEVYE